MAAKWKVIECSVDELENELNQIPDGFVPAVFHFDLNQMPSKVVVICTRPPQQQTVAMPVMMPARGRN